MSEDERWISIDAAAAGLNVSVPRAYVIARVDGWAKTGGRPATYALSDVRATHARMKAERERRDESEGSAADRPRAEGTRLLVIA